MYILGVDINVLTMHHGKKKKEKPLPYKVLNNPCFGATMNRYNCVVQNM